MVVPAERPHKKALGLLLAYWLEFVRRKKMKPTFIPIL